MNHLQQPSENRRILPHKSLQKDFYRVYGVWESFIHITKPRNVKFLISDPINDSVNCFVLRRLKRLRTVNSLTLEFMQLQYCSQKSISYFREGFKSLKTLHSVHLFLSFAENFDGSCFRDLFQGVSELKYLKRLGYDFDTTAFHDRELAGLILGTRKLKKLKSLDHRFECANMTDKGVRNLALQWDLSHLGVSFSFGPELTDLSFEFLKQRVLELSSLQTLEISLFSVDITNKGMVLLGLGLMNLPLLRSLKFRMEYSKKVTDDSFSALGQALEKMSLLHTFDLQIAPGNNETVENLKSGIIKLKSLTNFHLDLRHGELTGPGLKCIEEMLPHLTNLRCFSFKFMSGSVHNPSYKEWTFSFQGLESLQSFYLGFPSYHTITAKEILKAMKGL